MVVMVVAVIVMAVLVATVAVAVAVSGDRCRERVLVATMLVDETFEQFRNGYDFNVHYILDTHTHLKQQKILYLNNYLRSLTYLQMLCSCGEGAPVATMEVVVVVVVVGVVLVVV